VGGKRSSRERGIPLWPDHHADLSAGLRTLARGGASVRANAGGRADLLKNAYTCSSLAQPSSPLELQAQLATRHQHRRDIVESPLDRVSVEPPIRLAGGEWRYATSRQPSDSSGATLAQTRLHSDRSIDVGQL